MTPFLALVLAGFATFMLVLGFVSVRNYVDDLRVARAAATRVKVGARTGQTPDNNGAAVASSPSDEHHTRQPRRSLAG
jgi:hypothetical protein